MAPTESPTFRVRRIPAHVSGIELSQFLCDVVKDLSLHQLRIRSLAPTPDDPSKPPSQTATIQLFGPLPQFLAAGRENEWAVKVPGQVHALLFDTHFLGFTPLSAVDSGIHAFE